MTDKILTKQPSESDLYDIDFAPILRVDDDISSVTSVIATPSGLTIGAPTSLGQKVQVRISGGTNLVRYKISAIIISVAGNTKEADVLLRVLD